MKCLVCDKTMPFDCTCSDMGKRIQLVRDAKQISSSEELFKGFSKTKLGIDVDNQCRNLHVNSIVVKIFMYYQQYANEKERIGDMLDRVGWDDCIDSTIPAQYR